FRSLLQVGLESLHGAQRRLRRAIVSVALVGGHGGPDGLVHQRDIAFVFLDRHFGPDIRRREQVGGGLVEKQRYGLKSRDDIADARWLRRVFQHEWVEQR